MIVAGGATGIGAATAERLASEGAAVMVAGRQQRRSGRAGDGRHGIAGGRRHGLGGPLRYRRRGLGRGDGEGDRRPLWRLRRHPYQCRRPVDHRRGPGRACGFDGDFRPHHRHRSARSCSMHPPCPAGIAETRRRGDRLHHLRRGLHRRADAGQLRRRQERHPRADAPCRFALGQAWHPRQRCVAGPRSLGNRPGRI